MADCVIHEPVSVLAASARSKFRAGVHRLGQLELSVAVEPLAGGDLVQWSVRNPGRVPVTIDRIGLEVTSSPGRVVEHGWQSWSVVRRCSRDDVRPARRRAARFRTSMLVADPAAAGTYVAGDQFLVDEGGVCGFLSGRSHFGTITAGPDRITAWALLDGIRLPPGQERDLEPVWIGDGAPGELYSRFAELWGNRAGARASTPAPAGWCSWYEHQSAVTPDDVRRAARHCGEHGLGVVQIDDGYQAAIGDWTSPSPSWPNGTRGMAQELAEAGLTPGIWTAPFLAGAGSRALAEHPDWLVRDEAARPVGAMHHPRLWGGWAYALDTTHPAVLEHLRRTFEHLVLEGFAYHKLDFLYAAALAGRRHDASRTRAEALSMGLDAIRAAVGDDAFVLACGCPFGPAVGVVDAMRVSTDVWRHWSKPADVPGFAESRSGLRNSLRASVLRAPLHRRLWINDPDCVLLGRDRGGLSDHHRAVMVDTVAGTGGFTVVSDDLGSYRDADWDTVAGLLRASDGDARLDLEDPFAPTPVVRSPASELTVDWRDDGRSELQMVAS